MMEPPPEIGTNSSVSITTETVTLAGLFRQLSCGHTPDRVACRQFGRATGICRVYTWQQVAAEA